eukprot:GHRQ01008864.1.p1 GENE.GHRQ01008864.1~~GHRQ01008864.1.p1  ORF type:complete len:261 (+),score=34.39 GHRQ01008864.1:684-1466(+)
MRLFALARLDMQALSRGVHTHSTPSKLAAACRVRLANSCFVPTHIKRRYSVFVASTMSLNKRIGFMGSGQMAEALARGLIDRGVVQASQICCSDPAPARKDLFRSLGCTPYDTNLEVAKNCDVVFVSVKPQYVHTVLTEARPVLKEDSLVISIAAGITVAQLLEAAGPNARVCRVMPNTPCLVGESAAAMCLGGKASAEDGEVVVALLSAVGKIYQLDEKLLAAVTGLSGSGPAYIYMLIEALADGGVRAGGRGQHRLLA